MSNGHTILLCKPIYNTTNYEHIQIIKLEIQKKKKNAKNSVLVAIQFVFFNDERIIGMMKNLIINLMIFHSLFCGMF